MFDKPFAFRKILVATDFSALARGAFEYAIWVAQRSRGEVVLAHVISNRAAAAAETGCDLRPEIAAANREKIHGELQQLCGAELAAQRARHRSPKLVVRHATRSGRPFVEIIRAAHAEAVDLVLAGTRGLSGWKRFVLGSTAMRLIRKCPCSVWIVHTEHFKPPQKILVAIDFSAVSRKACRQARWLAQQAGAELHLLHVIKPADWTVLDVIEPEDDSVPLSTSDLRGEADPLRPEERAVQTQLEELVQLTGPDPLPIPIQLHVTISPEPWRSISSLAKRLRVDLVALGTVGRSGIPGLLLGSTAEKVLHSCTCGILTTKPDGFVSPILASTTPPLPECA